MAEHAETACTGQSTYDIADVGHRCTLKKASQAEKTAGMWTSTLAPSESDPLTRHHLICGRPYKEIYWTCHFFERLRKRRCFMRFHTFQVPGGTRKPASLQKECGSRYQLDLPCIDLTSMDMYVWFMLQMTQTHLDHADFDHASTVLIPATDQYIQVNCTHVKPPAANFSGKWRPPCRYWQACHWVDPPRR